MTSLHPVTHRLIGSPTQVANVLRAAYTRGHLVACGQPEPLAGHRVAITITVLEPARTARRPSGPNAGQGNAVSPAAGPQKANRRATGRRPVRRWLRLRRWLRPAAITIGALAAAATFAGLLWLLALAVRWVQDHWAPLGCLAVVLALAYAAAQENHR